MQSVNDINHLAREALSRWLKPPEVYFILQNYEEHQLTHQVPQRPASGSLYLFNKRVVKFFRKDGHSWRRRKDQRTIAEAHERLKVGNVEALNCYYAHGDENPYFQRRSYWILDQPYEHIVLVHYRDIREGKQNNGPASHLSPLPSSNLSPSPNSFVTHQADSSVVINGSYYSESSPSSVEISSSEVTRDHWMDPLGVAVRAKEVTSSSEHDINHALRRIEHQLSLNDDEANVSNAFYFENEDSNDLEDALHVYDLSGQTSNSSDSILYQQHSDDWIPCHQHPEGVDGIWKDMLDGPNNFQTIESHAQVVGLEAQDSSFLIPQKINSSEYAAYSLAVNSHGINPHSYSLLPDQVNLGIPVEDNISLTVAQKQKFTIREISPEWCYASEGAKIIIVGSFLCNPLECKWACMFGDTEVPVQIIQEGVIRCHAPAHLQGKITLCITSGNRESCSEVREFEYRDKPGVCTHNSPPEREPVKSSDELLLLVRFVQMLLSGVLPKVDGPESTVDISSKSRFEEDLWNQIIDALLDGTSTLSGTLDQLLQELLKDKLANWLSSRIQNNGQKECSLSKKEQGLIHMVAGLGFEWALQPILNAGVSINFRDINGWTALHWAARFGRERMVAALIASGASAGAVTDPNSQDPNGKTAASIAATCGNAGLAGYLSEVALTSHLSSLVMEESELSKGSAAVEAERTVYSFSKASSTNEDRVFAAVRNAAQAAARIQSAFRAHSFRRRQQRGGDSGDEYSIFANDIHGLSTAAKLTFGSARDNNTAALSIQKKYRGWKGRKDFLTLRQKVVKIQAHVRGYQVRKNYKVCWAVGVLEKVVLRWRRRGVGLRGFKQDAESIDETEDEDILKVFRKQKVDAALDEAVSRVLSMVESPDARQQYHRLLEKYRQAKAQLENPVPDTASSAQHDKSSYHGFSYMEK